MNIRAEPASQLQRASGCRSAQASGAQCCIVLLDLVLVGNQQHPGVFNAGKPEFAELAAEIWRFHEGADILGYNALSFHVPLLAAEFIRMTASGISGVTFSGAENDSKFQVITMMR